MAAIQSLAIPVDVQSDLEAFLRKAASPLNVSEASRSATLAWLAAQRTDMPASATHVGGYQWKCLFLPNGSELRVRHDARNFYALVDGDRIVYQGRSFTPRQLTLAIAGDGRNAWRELWVRLPGEKSWQRAHDMRRALADVPVQVPPTPLEAMCSAAANMKAALASTLALFDKTSEAQAHQFERRVDRHRRHGDFAGGDVHFDPH